MAIKRIEPGPRMSKAVVHNGVVYLAGLTADDSPRRAETPPGPVIIRHPPVAAERQT
jgi:enamine deaminase RidA (YjgF/YER057c/UK114 family)